MKEKAKIFVFGPNYCVINGLERIILMMEEFSVCGQSKNADSIIPKIKGSKLSALVVEPSMGCNANLGLIRIVRRNYKNLPILVVSQLPEQTYAPPCIYFGATGYIPMDKSYDKIGGALHQVLEGKLYLSKPNLKDEVERLQKKGFVDPTSILTQRQLEVYRRIGLGYYNKNIAEELFISIRTVETETLNMTKLLGYKDPRKFRRDAILWTHGFIIDIANKKD